MSEATITDCSACGGEIVTLIGSGAWCPKCHTIWRETDEVDLADLDALPEEPTE